MLQFIRDKSQGVVAAVILGFVCLTFALWGIHNYMGGGEGKQAVAKVNGTKITQRDLEAAFSRFRQTEMRQNPQLFETQNSIAALKKQVLDSLVNTMLLSQGARSEGFSVGQNLLELELARMPSFQVDGQFSKLRFQQMLANMGYSQQGFFAAMKNSMLLSQVRAGFELTSFALPYQVDNAVRLIKQRRSYAYAIIPASKFTSDVKVTPAQISAYYKQNHAQFEIPKKTSLQYVVLDMKKLAAKINPTQADLHSYYNDNLNHFTKPKKWHLAHILVAVSPTATSDEIQAAQKKIDQIAKQANSGQSFADLAAKHSDDIATAHKGGLMPWITLMQVSTNWQKQMVVLNKVGQISAPFKTQQGFEIVKLEGIKSAVTQPYEKVAAKVKADYIQQTAEKQFNNLSDDLATVTFEHPHTLAPAAKKLGLNVESTAVFDQKGGDTAFTKNPRVIQAAFSSNVWGEDNNSNTIQVSPTQLAVIRTKQKFPASTKPLASVSAHIKSVLQAQQASSLAANQGQVLIKQMQAGKSLASVASINGLSVKRESNITRNNFAHLNTAIAEEAFQLEQPTASKPSIHGMSLPDGNYALVQLLNVQDIHPGLVKPAVKHFYKAGAERNLGALSYALYGVGLHDSADIKYYKQK